MSPPKHRARVGGLALVLAFLSNIALLHLGYAAPAAAPPDPLAAGQHEGVVIAADGSIKLSANAPPAPAVYGSFKRFGLAISPPTRFSIPFRTLRIDYAALAPPGSAVRFDVRASADGARWTAWETDLPNGSSASFDVPASFAQYRVTLLGSVKSGPVVRGVELAPMGGPALFAALGEAPRPVAPTYRVHATRQGMIGGRTANGHRITPRDHFVSLPSLRALSSNGGSEYLVRITYQGRSSVAPVYDVGPWNVHDNYWDDRRERFGDLPRGWPEDHAAFYDNYNGGRAEKGRVRFPTAIDIGDGVWWDDLGIRGDRAVVEVTFLWLGSDPLASPPVAPAPVALPAEVPPAAPAEAPPPAEVPPAAPAETPPPAEVPPAAPAETSPPAETPPAEAPAVPAPPPAPIVVDDGDPAFKPQAIVWYRGPDGCGDGGDALWTYTTPDQAESENVARWQPWLPADGVYDLYVAVPACDNGHADTTSARYLVQHRDGSQTVAVDQATAAGTWVLLGRFPFAAGEGGFVELKDVTDDSMRTLWYDAAKWVPVP